MMLSTETGGMSPRDDDVVVIVVDVLRRKFGDDAPTIASHQRERAKGEMRILWSEISEKLGR